MKWQVTDIHAKDGFITSAKYFVSHVDGDQTVETEGYWHFPEGGYVSFNNVTEEMVIGWIKEASMKDGVSSIELALTNQLSQPQKVTPPWLPQTFTIKV